MSAFGVKADMRLTSGNSAYDPKRTLSLAIPVWAATMLYLELQDGNETVAALRKRIRQRFLLSDFSIPAQLPQTREAGFLQALTKSARAIFHPPKRT